MLIVDIWKTTPFMALLCLAGLQMIPRDIYEAAKIDGIHPVKVFFKVTLPLVKPALMVAVIFRLLDALRIFDLIYVLTPNSTATKTMSIISRENLIDFDKFAYGSAQSTLLFLIIALSVILYIWLGKVDLGGEKQVMPHRQDRAASTSRSCVIVVVAVFPVLLRDHHQLQDRARRSSRSTTGRPSSTSQQLRRRAAAGRVPAQHPQLGLRRDADGRLRAAARR